MNEINIFRAQFRSIRELAPAGLVPFIIAVILIQFILVSFMPPTDFDSLSCYIVRIYFERIGPLKQTATLETLWMFPKFFDYLHGPLLDFGAFYCLPNFALFLAVLYLIVTRLDARTAIIALCLVFAAQPIVVSAVGAKNDITIGLFGILAWWAICRRENSVSYLPVAILGLCALVGTKYHGAIIAAPLTVALGYQLIRSRRPNGLAILLLVLLMPIYWYVSSAGVYLDNLASYRTPFPTPDYVHDLGLTPQHGIAKNLYVLTVGTIVEMFDLAGYLLDLVLGGQTWKVYSPLTLNTKYLGYAIMPNAHNMVWGLPLLVVLTANAFILVRRRSSFASRVAAASALLYVTVVVLTVRYNNYTARYLLASYLIGLIPTAELIAGYWPYLSTGARSLIKAASVATVAVISTHAALFSSEHPIVSHTERNYVYNIAWPRPSILYSLADPDRLFFQVWAGHWSVYQFQRANIARADTIAIINPIQGNDTPILLPFLRAHPPENTRIINYRNGQKWDRSLCPDVKFVWVFKGEELDDDRYEAVYRVPAGGSQAINIFRRKPDAC